MLFLFVAYLILIYLAFILLYGLIPIFKLWISGFNYPSVLPFVGNLHLIARYGFQKCLTEWNKELGPSYCLAYGQVIIYHIGDPAVLKDILIKSFTTFPNRRLFPYVSEYFRKSIFFMKDDEWRCTRRELLPIFMGSKIKHTLYPLMTHCAKQMLHHLFNDRIYDKTNGRTIISAKDLFGSYSMDIIASTAFGIDLDSFNDHEFVSNAKKILDFEVNSPLLSFILIFPIAVPILRCLNIAVTDVKSLKFFKDIILRVIEERRNKNISRNDLVQLFINGQRRGFLPKRVNKEEKGINDLSFSEGHKNGCLGNDTSTTNSSCKEVLELTEEEYVANALLFFIAGYESTSTTMCWLARNLAWNQDVQDKICNEIHDLLNKKIHSIEESESATIRSNVIENLNYEDVESLKYLTQTIKESMRLQPSTMFFDRFLNADHIIIPSTNKENKYQDLIIPKNSLIEVPIYAVHRDARNWDNPTEFNPDRFEGNESIIDQQCRFIPFGNGPRNCIGLRFAFLEIKIAMIYLLGNGIRFYPGPNDNKKDININETNFKRNLLNFPVKGIDLTVEVPL